MIRATQDEERAHEVTYVLGVLTSHTITITIVIIIIIISSSSSREGAVVTVKFD